MSEDLEELRAKIAALRAQNERLREKELRAALVQIGSCGDFGRGRCVDPDTDQAANAACQIS